MRHWKPLLLVYLLIILSPLLVVSLFGPETYHGLAYDIGRHLALVGFAILVMQVVLAARLRWVDRAVGLNLAYVLHRNMGIVALAFLLTHPLLLAAGGLGWDFLIRWDVPWFIWLARLGLLTLLMIVPVSLLWDRLGLQFETWRLGHDLAGPFILVLVFVHSWYAGGDLSLVPLQILWLALITLGVVLYTYHRLVRPRLLRRHPYRVTDVQQEVPGVWTLTFAPPPGREDFDFLPGQWQFLTLLRGRNLPEEEHHFTISSSPRQKGSHTSTIKEVGDFTATIGQTKPGDEAVIQGPFGRFSHVVHPELRDLVFIAGGIGITPLMSNLRHLRDTGTDKKVLLLYANSTEADIAFRDELAAMEAGEKPQLQVVHIISHPGDDWTGEKGHLDREKLSRLCGDRLAKSTFFISGPPGLVAAMLSSLDEVGVDQSRISVEYFAL
ncbi:MAG: ferric reductase-like transmembrane domain-containing protein [Thermodesulfobacteriota bacterium]